MAKNKRSTPNPRSHNRAFAEKLPVTQLTKHLKGRTLEDVAGKIGCSKSTLSLFFGGRRTSSAELVYYLAKELGVTMEALTKSLLVARAETKARNSGKSREKAVRQELERLQRGRVAKAE